MFGTFVAVVMVVSTAPVVTSADGDPQPLSIDAQVLGQVEARGWEPASSDGRSTNAADPAPGLSATPRPATPAPTPSAVPADTPTPTVAPDEAPTPTLVTTPAAPPTPTTEPAPTPIPTAAPAAAPTPTAAPAALESEPEEPPPPPPDSPPAGIEFDALDLIAYDWQARLPGWRIAFYDGRNDVRGLTYSSERRIEVYIRDGDTVWDVARVIAHELGHAVDLTHGSHTMRTAWRTQRSIDDDVPWWPGSATADFATGAGDFAECFASWQVGSRSLSQLAGDCTEDDLAMVAAVS